jgi:hypothetical protein
MLSDEEVVELRAVLNAQSALLQKMRGAIDGAEIALAGVTGQAAQASDLAALMAELECSAGLLGPEDLDGFDPDEIPRLYERRRAAVRQGLETLGCDDWPAFVARCRLYALKEGLDPLAPYEALLTDEDFQRLRDESYGAQFRWDRWDYLFVGAAGSLAALTDFLLVGIPRTMGPASEFSGQTGSPVTAWLKQYDTSTAGGRTDWFAHCSWQLEQCCKTPYDSAHMEGVGGMGGRTHRLQTLGHDPVLGFVVGVFDIMRGSMTGFSYDHLTSRHHVTSLALPRRSLVQPGAGAADGGVPHPARAPSVGCRDTTRAASSLHDAGAGYQRRQVRRKAPHGGRAGPLHVPERV